MTITVINMHAYKFIHTEFKAEIFQLGMKIMKGLKDTTMPYHVLIQNFKYKNVGIIKNLQYLV